MPEPIEVRKVPILNVSDASGLAALVDAGVLDADRVVAVIGKTEGNGGVNDYTRIIADRAFREVLVAKGTRTTALRPRSSQPCIRSSTQWSTAATVVIAPLACTKALVLSCGCGHIDRSTAICGARSPMISRSEVTC